MACMYCELTPSRTLICPYAEHLTLGAFLVQDLAHGDVAPALIVAACTGVAFVAAQLATINAGASELKNSIKELKDSSTELKKELKELKDSSDANVKELIDLIAGVPRLGRGTVAGLRQISTVSTPLTAFVAASPADVHAWLDGLHLVQYAPVLAPLGGVGLLLQTEATLAAAGVTPVHIALLLREIEKQQ